MWMIHSSGFGIGWSQNDTTILKGSSSALIDSGTSYLVVPVNIYNKIRYIINQSRPDCSMIDGSSHNGLSCDLKKGLHGLPYFWVNLAGKKFCIYPEDYALQDGEFLIVGIAG